MTLKILKKLKRSAVNSKRLFAFDVETVQYNGYDDENKTNQDFMMGSVVGEGIEPKVFWDKNKMAKFLLSETTKDSFIFATNLDFDFHHVFNNTEYEKEFRRTYHPKLIYARLDRHKNKWVFLDTRNYMALSVKNIGKMLNHPKLQEPKCFKRRPENFKEKQELINYNIRDSEVTLKGAQYFQNFCNYLGCKMKITIASTGIDNWRRNYQPHDLFQERRDWLEKHYEGSFHGGRTEVFKRGLIKDKFYCYDYNSHYPACCYEGVDGKGSYPDPNTVHYNKYQTKQNIFDYEGITNIKIRSPDRYVPLLGLNRNDKYIFPTGIVNGWFTNIEIRKALEVGYKLLDIKEGLYYTNTFIPFRQAVKDLYSKRLKFEKEGNFAMKQCIKIMMNSGLFGKFGQKLSGEEVYYDDEIHCDSNGQEYALRDNKKILLNDYVQRGCLIYNKIKNPKHIPLFVFPILASYTTAMARIKLWGELNRFPQEVIYCDTDSIYLKKKAYTESNKLGGLKLEHTVSEGIFIRPKMYYLGMPDGEEVCKVKGVNTVKSKENMLDLLKNKKVRMERFTSQKESAIRKVAYSTIISFDKNISFEDNKRLWQKKFSFKTEQDSKPIYLST